MFNKTFFFFINKVIHIYRERELKLSEYNDTFFWLWPHLRKFSGSTPDYEKEDIENKEEKIDFMGLWMERKGGWKIDEAQVFSLLIHQNYICPTWRENRGRKIVAVND